ncbi:hypothetical protein [Streptomyces sp. NPDC012888]|uniref:hypothetical protein n=1 Tax=Streptomyces sp. NPDC012888 TaxID=3364855 RepID=UPI003697755B
MNDDYPPIWFRLPPGFYDVSPAQGTELVGAARISGSAAAEGQIATLVQQLGLLGDHHVAHTAIGLHPDEEFGLCTSLFSLAIRPIAPGQRRREVGRAALGIAKSPLWTASAGGFCEHPSALPCCLVSGLMSVPEVDRHIFQARAALAHEDGHHLIVLDLTSAATQHQDNYTDVLHGIVSTISFSDPTPPKTSSRILEVLL